MLNADLLCSLKTEIHGEWYISKPLKGPLWRRVSDAWKVITGEAMALGFNDNLDLKDIIENKMQYILLSHENFLNEQGYSTEQVKQSMQTKFHKQLKMIGIDFKYDTKDLLIEKDGVSLSYSLKDGIKVLHNLDPIDVNDTNVLIEVYGKIKFKYIYDKMVSSYLEIEKSREFMKPSTNTDETKED